MLYEELAHQITQEFPLPPTALQQEAILSIAKFILSPAPNEVFILRGYAGTGKTTLVGALVRAVKKFQRDVVLLAPTGRAAKVFATHAQEKAYTIHKAIYRQKTFMGEDTEFTLGYNKNQHTIYVVDEASMVASHTGGSSLFGTGCLLDDLIHFVYDGEGCRLIFVGDTAQLPPVGENESPALSREILRNYGLRVTESHLTEVVRQSQTSGVLANATRLRQQITEAQDTPPSICVSAKGEVQHLPGGQLIEALVTAYQDFGVHDTIVVTRSNKRANIYNQGIRSRIFDREENLMRGDLIMAVKNNYYWTEQLSLTLPKGEQLPFHFIANGDTAEVIGIRNVHEQHGFHFADATLRFPDYDDFEMEVRVLLDTLSSESPSLTSDESNQLFENVLEDYLHIPTKKERMKNIRQDPYYNALQIKYAYAVTCHKAQGGQWSRVFIDQGYLPADISPIPYLRWLYTAFTRTTDRLYLVNWPKEQLQHAPSEES